MRCKSINIRSLLKQMRPPDCVICFREFELYLQNYKHVTCISNYSNMKFLEKNYKNIFIRKQLSIAPINLKILVAREISEGQKKKKL